MLVGVFSPTVKKANAANGENCSDHELSTQADCESAGFKWTPDPAVDTCAALTGLSNSICKVGQIFKMVIPVIVALGVIYFIWGVVSYVIGTEEETKKSAKGKMIYGIIGLAVIISMWGLVTVVINTFGLGGGAPSLPSVTYTSPSTSSTSGLICSDGDLGDNPKFQDLLVYVTCIIGKAVIPLIFTLAMAMFIWGVVQYVINGSDEAKKQKGRDFMIWGIIALAVMVSVWGLVNILGNTFGIDSSFIPKVKP